MKSEINTNQIADSGIRREFETGAVRDICEGKGRCDLLPLDVIADIYERMIPEERDICNIFAQIERFREDGDISHLVRALASFIDYKNYSGWCDMFLELAVHFEAGAKKYGENNWRRGIPVHCYIDSAVRHFLKFLRGDSDERHDRAFCWNLICCIWTVRQMPETDDFTGNEKNN